MVEVSTIGLDIAKRVFQVHGVDAAGAVVLRRQLRRSAVVKFFAKLPPCVVGLEACATAHYWGRQIAALGHRVRLMPPTRVKPYVSWGKKNDKADAQACCEAVSRPSMQFVPLKSVPEQAALMTHRARQLLVEQRTRLANAIRAQMAEIGVIARRGPAGLAALLAMIEHPEDRHLPAESVPFSKFWPSNGAASARRSPRSSARSSPGTRATPTACGSPPSRNSARSWRAPWSPPQAMPSGFAAAGNSPPGSDWCRRRTRPAAKSASAASPKPATAICASFWWSPPPA